MGPTVTPCPTAVTPCLQNTPSLSVTVAHLGLEPQRVRQDRLASDPVVVSLGGQRPHQTWPLRPEAKPIGLRCGGILDLTCSNRPRTSAGVRARAKRSSLSWSLSPPRGLWQARRLPRPGLSGAVDAVLAQKVPQALQLSIHLAELGGQGKARVSGRRPLLFPDAPTLD
jgi:hypothetical protein